MTASWRIVRVSISSTFKDMQSQRDYLVRFVFPKLREELLQRRIHLVDVDPRWCVRPRTSTARQQTPGSTAGNGLTGLNPFLLAFLGNVTVGCLNQAVSVTPLAGNGSSGNRVPSPMSKSATRSSSDFSL